MLVYGVGGSITYVDLWWGGFVTYVDLWGDGSVAYVDLWWRWFRDVRMLINCGGASVTYVC